MKATKNEPEVARPAVPALAAALATLQAERDRLGQVVTGVVRGWRTERVARAVVTTTGRVAEVVVDERVPEVEHTSAPERARAQRRLRALVDEIAAAEEALAIAQQEAAEAERARQAALRAAGTAEVRQALPALLTELRAVQGRMQHFAARMAALDQELGLRYFAEAAFVCLLEGRECDHWLRHVAAMFGVEPERR